jgi:hypothetical protein
LETHEEENDGARTESTAAGTLVTAALVAKTTFEDWSELKRFADQLGMRIVFQKIAPRKSFLWIRED